MREITLNKGLVALVDDEDFEYLNQFKWFVLNMRGNNTYARRTIHGKRHGGGKRDRSKTILMHREIMDVLGADIKIDHKDGNGLNNQRNNLRPATSSQNGANRKSVGTSKFLGVYWNRFVNKWHAQIRKDGKIKHLGLFKNEIDAAIAYNESAKGLHGDFARLNPCPIEN